MTITCTRRIQFCAGHRVVGHENKCSNLHGHNWVALITAEADALDKVGRVVDFSVLKERYGSWIDLNWDHGMILWREDPWAEYVEKLDTKLCLAGWNPTSENLANCLLDMGPALMVGSGVRIVSVQLHETENCYSTAS